MYAAHLEHPSRGTALETGILTVSRDRNSEQVKLFVELSDKTQHCLSMQQSVTIGRGGVKWRRGPGYMSIRASLEVVPMNPIA